MQIEVVLAGWEVQCCVATFKVGDESTWELFATDPADTPSGSPVRFEADQHGQTPDEVPPLEVTGTISDITGVRFPYLPVPGDPGAFVADDEHPVFEQLEIVLAPRDQAAEGSSDDEPDQTEFDEFRILVEVSEETVLPGFVRAEQTAAERLWEASERQQRLAWMADEVGIALESLADEAELRYAGVARFNRATDFSGLTIEPLREGATAVHWNRRDRGGFGDDDFSEDGDSGDDNGDGDGQSMVDDAEDDGDGDFIEFPDYLPDYLEGVGDGISANDYVGGDVITVFVGDGEWSWSATIENVELVGEFLLAAAEGRVNERVRPHARLKPSAPRSLDTEVSLADGRTLTSSTEYRTFSTGWFSFGVVGNLWERVERGDYDYVPWDPAK